MPRSTSLGLALSLVRRSAAPNFSSVKVTLGENFTVADQQVARLLCPSVYLIALIKICVYLRST